MEKNSYFIGICPSYLIERQIHGIKEEIRQKYGVKGAFRSIAHITMQMPFKLPIKKEPELISELGTIMKTQKPVEIELRDFGSFEPRVIFIKVIENEMLNSLQETLEQFMKKFQVFNGTHQNRGFHPHITVAFRDLKKPIFYEIWNEVKDKSFSGKFIADSITLFKHNGYSWDDYENITLNTPSN